MLGTLDVEDVVRRGDPAMLEPFALHVTFARLPPVDSMSRDAWFLVRLLQLSMEYLLFVRARDGDVLESISEELRVVERERDEFVESTQKWKARTRSAEKQVEKLHQVLQNIAKLLQIHGASPSAVVTIQTLLTELIAERKARRRKRLDKENESGNEQDDVHRPTQEARVCVYCGKIFSSSDYLDKHLVRRHAGETLERESPIKHKLQDLPDHEDAAILSKTADQSPTEPELAMQKMVQQVEQALRTHEEHLRSLAQEGALGVQKVYEKLHTESQLAEELKTTRLKSERDLEEAKNRLELILQQQKEATKELADIKQQIQLATQTMDKMGSVPGILFSPSQQRSEELSAAEAKINSLQQMLGVVNAELSASREELKTLQETHLVTLREKQELAARQVEPTRSRAVMQEEKSSQTVPPPTSISQYTQVDESVQNDTVTISQAAKHRDVTTNTMVVEYEEAGSQTTSTLVVDKEVQTMASNPPSPKAPVDPEPVAASVNSPSGEGVTISVVENIAPEAGTKTDKEQIPDYIQQVRCQELVALLTSRAQSAAATVASSDSTPQISAKAYSSIPTHKFVRSRFEHSSDAVKERVTSCLQQLEQFSSRFGVPAKSVWLSNENAKLVQQALHGHLEVLPSNVLAKMIDCESAINSIIEKEWMPQERNRQRALTQFKMEVHERSEASQGLIKRAMVAFGRPVQPEQPTSADSDDVHKSGKIESSVESVQSVEAVSTFAPGSAPIRRYSANNQLTIVVDGEAMNDNHAYIPDRVHVPRNEAESVQKPHEILDTIDPKATVSPSHQEDNTSLVSEVALVPDSSPEQGTVSLETDNGVVSAATTGFGFSERDESPRNVQELPTGLVEEANSSGNSEYMPMPHTTSDTDEVGKVVASVVTLCSQDDSITGSRTEDADGKDVEEVQVSEPHVNSYAAMEPRHADHLELSDLPVEEPQEVVNIFSSNFFEPDQLSPSSPLPPIHQGEEIEEHTLSMVASSEMSFASIPSLGTESVTMGDSTSTVPMFSVQQTADVTENEAVHERDDLIPVTNDSEPGVTAVETNSVMSFDESDIEEVILT